MSFIKTMSDKKMDKAITIYLIGLAGAGKYTTAKGLATHGYKVVDNHLINNPIFSLLDLDGITPIPESTWNFIREIRKPIFKFISQDKLANYVFTNVLFEIEKDHLLYNQVKETAALRESLFVPVKLFIAPEENERRIKNPERKQRFKQTIMTPNISNSDLITIQHPNLIELDVTNLTVEQAVRKLLEQVKNISHSQSGNN